jgi:hypothetical protein
LRFSLSTFCPATFAVLIATVIPVTVCARETASDPDRYSISVMSIGPGDEFVTRAGHIALIVDDYKRKRRTVYNYGMYEFDDSSMATGYAAGHVRFHLGVMNYRMAVVAFADADRTIEVRRLDMPQALAAAIAKRLSHDRRPENRYYDYHHSDDNCCTRVRDLLDDVLGGAVTRGRDTEPTGRTYREWTAGWMAGMPVGRTIMHFLGSGAVDREITRRDEQTFPKVLVEDLDTVLIGPHRSPLVADVKVVFNRRGAAVGVSWQLWELVVVLFATGLFAVGFVVPLARPLRTVSRRLLGLGFFTWGLLCMLGSIVLFVAWAFTDHTDVHANENLLVMPVTHVWLLIIGAVLLLRGTLSARAVKLTMIYLLAATGVILLDMALKLGPFVQDNWRFIAFSALMNTLLTIGLSRTSSGRSEGN